MGERPRRDPRLERLRHKVPSWYTPLHLGVTIGLLGGGSIALLALLPLGPPPLIAWIAAAVAILAANFVEYALHRWPMHRRRPLTQAFFRQHTVAHHRYFTHDTMEVQGPHELTFVLPSLPVLLASVAFVALIVMSFGAVLGFHVGIFAGAILGFYGALSQLLHMAFHLPENWMKLPFLRSRLFYWMREHHAIHHDLRLMTKWNFNIGIPICDALFGTLVWDRDHS